MIVKNRTYRVISFIFANTTIAKGQIKKQKGKTKWKIRIVRMVNVTKEFTVTLKTAITTRDRISVQQHVFP